MSATPTETLFTCPNCKGYYFNIGVGGTLVCTNKRFRVAPDNYDLSTDPCGWIGRLPSDGALNTAPTIPPIQIRTAEQAREATEQAVRKEFQEEFKKVEAAIQKATQLGHSGASLQDRLNNKVIRTLENLGYRVTGHTAEPYETRIAW